MLLHGIMSSIAEFYSQNLATEVRKGMNEKVKSGGTVSRAPIGYQNVRYNDEQGREVRTVIVDPERAPLIKLAFEEYATGQWTVADLADHLAACGLNTRATPKIPSQPVTLKTMHKVLVNPYYKGVVTYKGIEYPGNHEPLVSMELWDTVQNILASRLNGERNFKHPHYLKSSVYCGYCGERLLVTNTTKKNGTVYPYFTCAGKHAKRSKDCKSKAILISTVEKEIEKLYDTIQIPGEIRILLEARIQELITSEKKKYEAELAGIMGEKARLENQRKKLLEAHFSDAIPVDLLKSEQKKISKELANIEHEIDMHNLTFDQITENLKTALDIVEDCGKAYRLATDSIKRLMNQAIFEKLYVTYSHDEDISIQPVFKAPYDTIIKPIENDLVKINRASKTAADNLESIITTAKDRIRAIFGCGLSDIEEAPDFSDASSLENSTISLPDSYYPNFFGPNSLSKAILVELMRSKQWVVVRSTSRGG